MPINSKCDRNLGSVKSKDGQVRFRSKGDVLREEMLKCVTVGDVKKVVRKLIDMAADGNIPAMRLFLFHLVGNQPLMEVAVVNQVVNATLVEDSERESELNERAAMEEQHPEQQTCKHGSERQFCYLCRDKE